MSSIAQAERQLTEARSRLHDARTQESKEKVGRLLKNGSPKELGNACRQLAGLLNPPIRNKRKEQSMPISQ